MTTKKRKYYLHYTVFFTITFCLAYSFFFTKSKSFIRAYDGIDQQYVFFVFIGKWLRQIIADLFFNHTFSVPLWTYEIGYGADVITSANAIIGDPFNLLSVLCPIRYAEYLFCAISIFKMYLTGIVFSKFAFYFKQEQFPTLCGALLYSLCGFMLVVPTQSFFVNPMIIFPLLLMETDKCLKGKSPVLYIVYLTLSFINFFYFAYMMSIMVFLYCLVWYFIENPNKNRKIMFYLFGKFVICSCIGFLISAAFVLPVTDLLLAADRVSMERNITLLYSAKYYADFLAGFINSASVGPDSFIGFTPLALTGVILMFFEKRNKFLKIIFISLTVIACCPLLGSAMNGFAYASNRWIWAYALCVSFIFTITLPKLMELPKAKLGKIIVVCATHCILVLLTAQDVTMELLLIIIIYAAYLIVLYFINHLTEWKKNATLFCLIGFLTISTYGVYSPICNAFWEQINLGSALNMHTVDSSSDLVKRLDDPSSWRYDSYNASIQQNNGLIQDLKSFNFYSSFYNNNVDKFHQEMAFTNMPSNFKYSNLESNVILTKLLGAKYFLVKSYDTEFLPYGYDKKVLEGVAGDGMYSIYTSETALPLAFTYEKVMSRQTYEQLSPLEKQELIMEYCVMDMDAENFSSTPALSSEEVSYRIAGSDRVSLEEKCFTVEDSGGTVSLLAEELSPEFNYFLLFEDINCDSVNRYNIFVSNGERRKKYSGYMPESHLYGGKHTGLIDLGTGSSGENVIDLSFQSEGKYTFNNISLWRLPVSVIDEKLENRVKASISDLKMETNAITCSRQSLKDEILFISSPYSKGWKASVNGEAVEIRKANTAFMAIPLQKGDNQIRLEYMTPMLLEGLFLSCLGLTGLCTVAWLWRKNKKSSME